MEERWCVVSVKTHGFDSFRCQMGAVALAPTGEALMRAFGYILVPDSVVMGATGIFKHQPKQGFTSH